MYVVSMSSLTTFLTLVHPLQPKRGVSRQPRPRQKAGLQSPIQFMITRQQMLQRKYMPTLPRATLSVYQLDYSLMCFDAPRQEEKSTPRNSTVHRHTTHRCVRV